MCGVAGYLNTDGSRVDPAVLERMIEGIHHRGPDDRGIWTRGSLGLAHARLSILDLSRLGHQPFLTADGTGVISYNGEVYNFRELRARLEKEGVGFSSGTDTEVVLYALHRWGVEAAVRTFDGMFAFAYYDLREGVLWLGRDPVGIKPLYLFEGSGTLAFASEMKALLAHPAVSGRGDLHALTTHVLRDRLTGSWTPFEGIEAVLPGTVVAIDPRGRREDRSYFDVLDDVDPARIIREKREPFHAQRRRFEDLLEESVRRHLISDAPLAVMCSGGLDSSLVTALAKREQPDIVAYVADVKGTEVREADRAEAVCRHLGVELRHVPVGRNEFLRLLPLAVHHNDQPSFYPQNVAAMAVSRAVNRDGFKVLLSGAGADELFGGYSWHADVHRMWRLRRLHQRLVPNVAPLRFLGRWLSRLQPISSAPLRARPFDHITTPEWVRRKIEAREVAVDGLQRDVRAAALFKMLEDTGPLEERAFLARGFEDMYLHLRTSLESGDKMGMSASVEIRPPFLGKELIDFGLHLPYEHKYRAGGGKPLVRAMAEQLLPPHIASAPKIGFETSATAWRPALEFLNDGYVARIFKWGRREGDEIRRRIRRYDDIVFRLLALELWGRIYVRGESPDGLGETLLSAWGEKETLTPGLLHPRASAHVPRS